MKSLILFSTHIYRQHSASVAVSVLKIFSECLDSELTFSTLAFLQTWSIVLIHSVTFIQHMLKFEVVYLHTGLWHNLIIYHNHYTYLNEFRSFKFTTTISKFIQIALWLFHLVHRFMLKFGEKPQIGNKKDRKENDFI